MSTRIIVNEARVNSIYERVMDEIYMMFHYHPLSFPTSPLSESELAEMNAYQGLGRYYQQLETEAKAARDRGDIGALQSVERQAKRFDPKINPKFAHLPRSGRTR